MDDLDLEVGKRSRSKVEKKLLVEKKIFGQRNCLVEMVGKRSRNGRDKVNKRSDFDLRPFST